ncbi:hypothetical protein JW848_09145, partial [Candidatus Bipolaricaulota bacterium]|nr:hypothetical protein [Candidatus Bipolaricaulota bacterium]
CFASDVVERKPPEISMEGSFGAAGTAPEFSAGTWLELSLTYAGFGLGSLTSFALDPALSGEQQFRALFGWEWLELGTMVEISLVPYAFQTGLVYLDLTLADVAAEDPFPRTFFALLSLDLSWFPDLAPSIVADVRTALGPLSTAMIGRIGVVPFVWQESWFEVVVSFLETALGDEMPTLLSGDLTARIGLAPTLETDLTLALGCQIGTLTAQMTTEVALYPALAANQDLIATILINAWAFTASTRFDLLPYGFQEQRIAGTYCGDHFEAHAALVFSQTAVVLDAGFEVTFP